MQAIRQKMPLPGSDPKDSDSSDFHMNFCYIFIVSVCEMYVKLFYIFYGRYFVFFSFLDSPGNICYSKPHKTLRGVDFSRVIFFSPHSSLYCMAFFVEKIGNYRSERKWIRIL